MNNSRQWPSTCRSLIDALQQQFEGPAWDQFVDIYGPLVYRFCRRRGVQDADARDVIQIVFLAVRGGITRFRIDPARGRFRSWLGTVIARAIARHYRDLRRAGQPVSGFADEIEVDDAAWTVEFNSHIYQTALDRIRPGLEDLTWQAFDLTWNQDLSPDEVANRLKKSPDWVYQVKYRVLRRLEAEIRFLTADIPSFHRE